MITLEEAYEAVRKAKWAEDLDISREVHDLGDYWDFNYELNQPTDGIESYLVDKETGAITKYTFPNYPDLPGADFDNPKIVRVRSKS